LIIKKLNNYRFKYFFNQSNRPPIPTSYSYSFGGSGCLATGFVYFFSYFAGLASSFLGASLGAEVKASSSAILKLNKSIITLIQLIRQQYF
jgi:hypothetical protein